MAQSLGRIRAERTGDAKAWTPLEMLEDLIREAREGTVDLTGAVVIFQSKDDEHAQARTAGLGAGEEFVLVRNHMRNIAELD